MNGKVDIDFSVHSNPYFLKVLDLSNWALIENEPSIIEITKPGYESSKITKYFDKHKNNIFNSTLLDINCADGCEDPEKLTLPDGIYTIKVIGSPSTFYKQYYYLKTDLFDMEVDKIYIDNQKSKNRADLIDQLTEIEFLIASANAFLRADDITSAGYRFEKAQEMVEDLKNCRNCK